MGLSSYLKIGGVFVAALLIGVIAYMLYHTGQAAGLTTGALQTEQYKNSVAQTDNAAMQQAFGRYASDVARNQAAEAGYIKTQNAEATKAKALSEQIDAVTLEPREIVDMDSPATLGPKATPNTARTVSAIHYAKGGKPTSAVPAIADCDRGFTAGFVRLWNAAAEPAAIGKSDPGTKSDDSPDSVGDSGATAAACSGVSQADVLQWFVDYANRTHTIEGKLTAIAATQASDAEPAIAASVPAVQ